MKLDESLAAVHAYLCADGYVIKNPENSKYKYFHIGFRNTSLTLLKDFQERFEKVFKIKPYLIEGQRCRIGSKEIYELLTNKFGSFYSWEWRMPKLNNELSKIWLRAYFDCEGWVFCKKHQNRHIGADCVNEEGLNQVETALNKLGIKTIRKYNRKKKIYRLIIYGKENLERFKEKIGFLHSNKAAKLEEVSKDYIVYLWNFPKENEKCKRFIKEVIHNKIKVRRGKYLRIFSKEEKNLIELGKLLNKFYDIKSRITKAVNGLGTIYYELNIYTKEDIQKLINLKLIPNAIRNGLQRTIKKS